MKTFTIISANENNLKEVEIVYKKTFFQSIFNKQPTTKTFIYVHNVWVNKETGIKAKFNELCDIVNAIDFAQNDPYYANYYAN